MRTISDSAKTPATKSGSKTFSTTLSDGREITIREMIGRDLIFMERDLSSAGDVEKGMKIIEQLCVGDNKITYDEILELNVRDFRKLSELVGKANAIDEEDSPN
jgi:hypothetical protein